jgi:hypothetical protein
MNFKTNMHAMSKLRHWQAELGKFGRREIVIESSKSEPFSLREPRKKSEPKVWREPK